MEQQTIQGQSDLTQLKVIGISGSMRTGSYNTQALRLALRIAAEAGAQVSEINLKELSLPLFDEDILSTATPESVRKIKQSVEESDLILIASPEYNHSITSALKNAIDWLSRNGNSLNGKTAAVFGVSAGIYGTVRGQFHLRQILNALNVYTLPQPQVFIGNADTAFAPDGTLNDKKIQDQLQSLISKSLTLAKTMKGM